MDEDIGLLRASIAYPVRGEASRTRLLFGAGLHFLAGVVAVGAGAAATAGFGPSELAPVWVAAGLGALLAYVPLLGYTAATIRELLDDEPAPPGFGDWGTLLRDGRRFAGVAVLYAIPPVALVGLAALFGPEGGTSLLAAVAAAGVYALAAAYVLPAALVAVVYTGERGTAWDARLLRDAVVDRRYLGRWLLASAVATVGTALGAAFAPFVVGFAILFATHLVAVRVVTHGVVLSLDLTLDDPPPPPASGYVPGWDDGSRRKELSDGRLGGSLLPTTPGEDDGGAVDTDEAPPTPGSLATTGDGGDGSTDLDRPSDGPGAGSAGPGAGGSSTGSAESESGNDIAPYEKESDEIDTADGE